MITIIIIRTFFVSFLTHLPLSFLLTPCSQRLQTSADPQTSYCSPAQGPIAPKASPTRSYEMDMYDLDNHVTTWLQLPAWEG